MASSSGMPGTAPRALVVVGKQQLVTTMLASSCDGSGSTK